VWDGTEWSAFPGSSFGTVPPSLVIAFQGSLFGVFREQLRQWDGRAWRTVGTFAGASWLDAIPLCVGSDGENLFVGGAFAGVDGQPMPGIAAWNGTSWRALGDGLSWRVQAVTIGPQAVYAAGVQQSTNSRTVKVAAFANGTWTPMDTGLNPGGSVAALAYYNQRLWLAGNVAVGITPNRSSVAIWDSDTWRAPAMPLAGTPQSLAVVDNRLYVGGSGFGVPDYRSSAGVVYFDDPVWRPAGDGLPVGQVAMISEFQGEVVAGGVISRASGGSALGAVTLSEGQWMPMGPGISHAVTAITRWQSRTVAGGYGYVSAWVDGQWSKLGGRLGSEIRELAEFHDQLFVCGPLSITENSGQTARGLLRWNGQAWESLPNAGAAVSGPTTMIVYDDRLVVFGAGGSIPVSRWDGSVWDSSMGALTGSAPEYQYPFIRQAAVASTGLIVAGNFASAGGVATRAIARWDGSGWRNMDAGLPISVSMDGIAEWEGSVYAVSYGGLMRWDGQSWQTVQLANSLSGVSGRLIARPEGLYCASYYFGVMRFDGSAWRTVGGSYMSSGQSVAASIGADLWIGRGTGSSVVDRQAIGYVARWTPEPSLPRIDPPEVSTVRARAGSTFALRATPSGTGPFTNVWSHGGVPVVLGTQSTLGYVVDATAGVWEVRLLVGGSRPGAAGQYTATVSNPCGATRSEVFTVEITCGADFDGDGLAGWPDVLAYLDAWFRRDMAADEDGYSGITVQDLFLFLGDYFAGCT
jgi:hypothetical protein